MLKNEDNELITRVGPGTPMGELFRRFWLPVVASDDVERDGAPVRLRILGEDLVTFRDSNGDVGLLGAYCAHRRANLFFGRNEDCGLRCVYHGWKFDVHGRCVDVPSSPPPSNFKDKVKTDAYPVVEKGGLVWAYMGPDELRPNFPEYEWAEVPAEHRVLSSTLVECNWLQTLEGDVDTAHVSFLHRALHPTPQYTRFVPEFPQFMGDKAPTLTVRNTTYGFVYGGRRTDGAGNYYWRFSHWLAPSTSETPGRTNRPGRVCVPIDDENTASFSFAWDPSRPLSAEEVIAYDRNGGRPLEPWALRDGYVIDTRRSPVNRQNDYKMDRKVQKSSHYSGMSVSIPDQDRAMTESMEPPIVDRSKEHLGTSDIAVIAMRRRLIRMARDLQRGLEPELAKQNWAFRTRGFDVVSQHADFEEVLEEHAAEVAGGRVGQAV